MSPPLIAADAAKMVQLWQLALARRQHTSIHAQIRALAAWGHGPGPIARALGIPYHVAWWQTRSSAPDRRACRRWKPEEERALRNASMTVAEAAVGLRRTVDAAARHSIRLGIQRRTAKSL